MAMSIMMTCQIGCASCGDAASHQRDRRADQHAVDPAGTAEAGRGRQTTEMPNHSTGGDGHPHGRESVRATVSVVYSEQCFHSVFLGGDLRKVSTPHKLVLKTDSFFLHWRP